MRVIIAVTFAAGAAIWAAGNAVAQELPNWAIAGVCAKDSVPAQCARSEGQARNSVSGGWTVLPAPVRTACLAALKAPVDNSWRLLSECIESETLKGLDGRAIATRYTPAPPLAPPLSSDGVPKPPFGLPAEAPKVQ